MNEEQLRYWVEQNILAVIEVLPEDAQFKDWPIYEQLIDNALIVAEYMEKYLILNREEYSDFLLNISIYLLDAKCSYCQAEKLCLMSLTIREWFIHEHYHHNFVYGLCVMGRICLKQGNYNGSEFYLKRSIEYGEVLAGKRSIFTTVPFYDDIIKNNKNIKEYDDFIYKKNKDVIGDGDVFLMMPYNDLAELYRLVGNYSEAEVLYKKSLSISYRIDGYGQSTAQVLNNLALLYDAQKRYKEAAPLFENSLAIREKILGKNHPDIAQSLNNLAFFYENQGEILKAESLYNKSLAIYELCLGKDHVSVALALNNLGMLYHNQCKNTEAEQLIIRSLNIRENNLGENHPDVAESLNNLAEIYKVQSRYLEAEPLYKRCLAICHRTLGAEHTHTRIAMSNYKLFLDAKSKDNNP